MTALAQHALVVGAVAAAHGLDATDVRRLLADPVGQDPVAAQLYAQAPPRTVAPLDLPALNTRAWITPRRDGATWGWVCRCGTTNAGAPSSAVASGAARRHLREAHPEAWPAPRTARCRCGQGGLWLCSRRRMLAPTGAGARSSRDWPVWVYACPSCGVVALATTVDRASAHLRYLGHPAALPTEPVYEHHTRVLSPDWSDLLAWVPVTRVSEPPVVAGHDPARCVGCPHGPWCADCHPPHSLHCSVPGFGPGPQS